MGGSVPEDGHVRRAIRRKEAGALTRMATESGKGEPEAEGRMRLTVRRREKC